jgi:hypothetical protein
VMLLSNRMIKPYGRIAWQNISGWIYKELTRG